MSEKQKETQNDLVGWFYVDNLTSEIALPAIYQLVAKASSDTYIGVLFEDFGEKRIPPHQKKFFRVSDFEDDGFSHLRLMNPCNLHQHHAQAIKQTSAHAKMKIEEEKRAFSF
jgi:hypothetical protein